MPFRTTKRRSWMPVLTFAVAAGCLGFVATLATSAESAPEPMVMAGDEFPSSWYFYGDRRPDRLRALDGS